MSLKWSDMSFEYWVSGFTPHIVASRIFVGLAHLFVRLGNQAMIV